MRKESLLDRINKKLDDGPVHATSAVGTARPRNIGSSGMRGFSTNLVEET
jgi:hypothetical protein